MGAIYIRLKTTRELPPTSGRWGSVRVRMEIAEAVGIPRELFLHRAIPTQYDMDGKPIGMAGDFACVVTPRELAEYPAYRPDPGTIWAYSMVEALDLLGEAVQQHNEDVGRISLSRLRQAAQEADRPRILWPFYRLPYLDVRLRNEEEADEFIAHAQMRLRALREKLEVEGDGGNPVETTFGTDPTP